MSPVRRILLTIHLSLGVAAGLFLVVLGVTGSIMAFETDIPHWLHPELFFVQPGPSKLPEQELIRRTEQQFAPARVTAVQVLRAPNLARVMQLPGNISVFVNPYSGAILGSVKDGFSCDRILGYIHQIHLRLTPDPRSMPGLAKAGKTIVNYAGLILCLLVPTGLLLFWRTRRFSIKWTASWFRVFFDLHHVVGLWASLFLFTAAVTGVLIGFESGERLIFTLSHSERPARLAPARSKPAETGAMPITADRAIGIANAMIPDAAVDGYFLPVKATDTFNVLLRVPEETSGSPHSAVAVDQFSGEVLQVRNFRTDSRGYMWVRFNRSIHTGDIFGTPTHIVAALSSLILVVMVLTGLVIWWRKLAI